MVRDGELGEVTKTRMMDCLLEALSAESPADQVMHSGRACELARVLQEREADMQKAPAPDAEADVEVNLMMQMPRFRLVGTLS